MKLREGADARFAQLRSRFDRIEARYAAFLAALKYFKNPGVAVLGVSVDLPDTEPYAKASFGTVTVGFRLLHALSTEGSALGRVVCILESPASGSERPVIGSFTFNSQGFTDFEVPGGSELAEIEYSAPEIVLHFLDVALARPAPNNW